MEELKTATENREIAQKEYDKEHASESLLERTIDLINLAARGGMFKVELGTFNGFYFNEYSEKVDELRKKIESLGYKTEIINELFDLPTMQNRLCITWG